MKCIVIETSPERINARPVTNEDGTPHIYATIKEARAELKANGYSYNRANDRYYIQGTEYRAYIVREDSAEFAEIIEQAETAAAYAAFEANRREHIGEYLVKYEWSGEGLYRIAWSDGGQKSDPHHYESAEELAADLTSAYQHATETHQPYAERLEYYERAELLAYLGESSDFDLEAIEQEATDTDEHGSRYWTADAEELEAIAQRNQR